MAEGKEDMKEQPQASQPEVEKTNAGLPEVGRRTFLKVLAGLGLTAMGAGSRQVSSDDEPREEAAGSTAETTDSEAPVDETAIILAEDDSITEPEKAAQLSEPETIPWSTFSGQAKNDEEKRILADETAFATQRMNEYIAVIERLDHPELNRKLNILKEALNAPRVPGQDRTNVYIEPSYTWNEPDTPGRVWPPVRLGIGVNSSGVVSYSFIFRSSALGREGNKSTQAFPILHINTTIYQWEKLKDLVDSGRRDLALSYSQGEATREEVVIVGDAYRQTANIYRDIVPKLRALGIGESVTYENVYREMQVRRSQSSWLSYINQIAYGNKLSADLIR